MQRKQPSARPSRALPRARTLGDAQAAREWFPVRRALSVSLDVARALTDLERRGRLHLGVCPQAIRLLTPRTACLEAPRPQGSARGGRSPLAPGLAPYAAPEQRAGSRTLDARADLYAFGGVLFHMLSGRAPPQAAGRPPAAGTPRPAAPPVRLWREALPAELGRVLRLSLAPRPRDRYASATRLLGDLLEAASALGR